MFETTNFTVRKGNGESQVETQSYTLIVTSSAPSATMIRTGGASLSESIYRSCTARREFFTNSKIMRCRCGVTYLQSRVQEQLRISFRETPRFTFLLDKRSFRVPGPTGPLSIMHCKQDIQVFTAVTGSKLLQFSQRLFYRE